MTTRVALCIPYYRHFEADMALSLVRLVGVSVGAGIGLAPIGCRGAYVEDNRNGCIEAAINLGIEWDWVFWVDTDMVFPGDALLRLLKHDKDIVGVNYRQRTPPHRHVGVYKDQRTHLLAPGLVEMEQMPTGLLLTRFEIYKKLGYPWFRPGLHHEARDDIYFCRESKKLGYSIWCDQDLTKEVAHINDLHIPWFSAEQLIEVKGTEIDNEATAKEARERQAAEGQRFMANASAA